jgi:tungstate transport system substrate-binding protein
MYGYKPYKHPHISSLEESRTMSQRALNLFGLLVLIMALVLSACGATPTATPVPPTATKPAAPTATTAPPTATKPAATAAPAAAATTAPAATATKPAATAAATTAPAASGTATKGCTLRLATTTSTADTGLLDAILPVFEKANNCKVDTVAVGSGQAITIGSKGDADVLLVHSRAAEDKFVADGFAKKRDDVMYNDFILVGPKTDPAGVKGVAAAKDAFKAIADKQQPFVSRGDASGTNTKELGIWSSAGITPTKDMKWYSAIGQGMGDTLVFANENKAYTLADRGTWLALKSKLPNLDVVVGGNTLTENKDKALLNPYGVLAVNPDKFPSVNAAMASNFVAWILSPATQTLIANYGVDKFGQQLFYPNAAK